MAQVHDPDLIEFLRQVREKCVPEAALDEEDLSGFYTPADLELAEQSETAPGGDRFWQMLVALGCERGWDCADSMAARAIYNRRICSDFGIVFKLYEGVRPAAAFLARLRGDWFLTLVDMMISEFEGPGPDAHADCRGRMCYAGPAAAQHWLDRLDQQEWGVAVNIAAMAASAGRAWSLEYYNRPLRAVCALRRARVRLYMRIASPRARPADLYRPVFCRDGVIAPDPDVEHEISLLLAAATYASLWWSAGEGPATCAANASALTTYNSATRGAIGDHRVFLGEARALSTTIAELARRLFDYCQGDRPLDDALLGYRLLRRTPVRRFTGAEALCRGYVLSRTTLIRERVDDGVLTAAEAADALLALTGSDLAAVDGPAFGQISLIAGAVDVCGRLVSPPAAAPHAQARQRASRYFVFQLYARALIATITVSPRLLQALGELSQLRMWAGLEPGREDEQREWRAQCVEKLPRADHASDVLRALRDRAPYQSWDARDPSTWLSWYRILLILRMLCPAAVDLGAPSAPGRAATGAHLVCDIPNLKGVLVGLRVPDFSATPG